MPNSRPAAPFNKQITPARMLSAACRGFAYYVIRIIAHRRGGQFVGVPIFSSLSPDAELPVIFTLPGSKSVRA